MKININCFNLVIVTKKGSSFCRPTFTTILLKSKLEKFISYLVKTYLQEENESSTKPLPLKTSKLF